MNTLATICNQSAFSKVCVMEVFKKKESSTRVPSDPNCPNPVGLSQSRYVLRPKGRVRPGKEEGWEAFESGHQTRLR